MSSNRPKPDCGQGAESLKPAFIKYLASLAICWLLGQTCARADGEPWVETSDAGGGDLRIRAHILIDAPATAVWSILVACEKAPKVIPHLEACVMHERDLAGRWDVREHIINPPLLPRLRTIVRNDFNSPKRLDFKLLRGDMRRSDGAWILEPAGKGTKLSYEAIVQTAFPVPQFIVSRSIHSDFPEMLRNVRKFSLEKAASR